MKDTSFYDVIIVGAGASGLACALQCARRGKKTLLLEKQHQPARKILASGNGRCNLTNALASAADYRGGRELAAAVLQKFSFQQCLDFFHALGVPTVQEEAGRVFPRAGKSTAVAEALKLACSEAGVMLRTDCEVMRVDKRQGRFCVHTRGGEKLESKYCVLACGSCAYPQIGGGEDGYRLARGLGHTVVPLSPALCALNVREKAVARLQGIRVPARVRVPEADAQSEGELLFTAYGLSGPAALNVSGPAGRALLRGPVRAEVNFFPEIEDVQHWLAARVQAFGQRGAKEFFAGMLHENIANLLIDFTGLKKSTPCAQWTPNTLSAVSRALTAWPFTVTSLRPWSEAMVAAGGVKAAEINYNTLESLRSPGLYITGELLDVDGRSGGFNLHFAWGSGCCAAAAMPEE